tara:strand:+ start:105 stop:1787 length:1683 start_codon:yes stop_codon:yes gene_type:complete
MSPEEIAKQKRVEEEMADYNRISNLSTKKRADYISKMTPEKLADYKRQYKEFEPAKFAAEERKKAVKATASGVAEQEVDKKLKKRAGDESLKQVSGRIDEMRARIQLSNNENKLIDQTFRQIKDRESELMDSAKEDIERTSATGANAAEMEKVDEVASKLRQMERGEGRSNAVKRMSDVQRSAAKVATAEREQELDEVMFHKPTTKIGLQTDLSKLVKDNGEKLPDMIKEYPDSLNRSIKLKNVKVPLGKRKKKFEDGTSVETNDKRLRRLLSQITQFTEPGDDITLENVDLDFEGTRKMLELQQEYGEKAIEHSFEFIGLALAAIATKQLQPIFTLPFTGPILQVAKEEMSTLMGLFKFNFGLVLQMVETLYESRNRLKRIRDRGSFDKFSVDKDKSEAKISEQAYTRASTDLVKKRLKLKNKMGSADLTPEQKSALDATGITAEKGEVLNPLAQSAPKEVMSALTRKTPANTQSDNPPAMKESSASGAAVGGAKNKTRAKSGGGGTQLPYDQYADTGYNTGTSFFAFEGDMGGRFDNTFTPTAEQSSFFKSIDYYDKV